MSVTITVTDLKYPKGSLQPAQFPDGDLDANLAIWLAEAVVKVSTFDSAFQDVAAAHWVYYSGYNAIANRLSAMPTEEEYFNQVSRTWGNDRIQYYQRMAENHLKQFNAYSGQGQADMMSMFSTAASIEATW